MCANIGSPTDNKKSYGGLSSLLQIYLKFLEYQMEHSNECKKNFVAVYDGSSAIEDLKVISCLQMLEQTLSSNIGGRCLAHCFITVS